MKSQHRIAVLIPCYNEEVSIRKVVGDFQAELPDVSVYVFDNNSTDRSAQIAREAGATVLRVKSKGKGSVVRRMFADVEADIYLLVDGDDTYAASCAKEMIEQLLVENLDMVVGRRVDNGKDAYRTGHRFGNRLLTEFVAMIFGREFKDILSGYRVFSRRFVKSFPALASGFEIETELTVHALELRMPVEEIDTLYKSRLDGSTSKLHTYSDGFRILMTIFKLFRQERPLMFFGGIGVVFAIMSIGFAVPLLQIYLHTGLVTRLPTAILATGMMLVSFLSIACGLILDTVTRGRQEIKRLVYLGVR